MIQGIASMIHLSSLVNHDHHEKLSHVQGQTLRPTDPEQMSSHESKKEGAEKSAKTDLGRHFLISEDDIRNAGNDQSLESRQMMIVKHGRQWMLAEKLDEVDGRQGFQEQARDKTRRG